MAKRYKTIANQVRAELKAQNVSGYRLAKETGIDEATAYRFLNGQGINIETLDAACRYLGLELVRTDELVELRKIKGAGRP